MSRKKRFDGGKMVNNFSIHIGHRIEKFISIRALLLQMEFAQSDHHENRQ